MTPEGTQVWLHHVPECKPTCCRMGGHLLVWLRHDTLNFHDVTTNHKPQTTNPTTIE